MKYNLRNKNGTLTRYGLSCGYTETRGTDECYARLEQISSNGALKVFISGRWRREIIYLGKSLTQARAAFRSAKL